MRQLPRFTILPLAVMLFGVAACGDTPSDNSNNPPTNNGNNEPDGSESDKYGVDKNFDPTSLPSGSATEDWGIGDKWYDYNFNKHSVTPRPYSWVVRMGESAIYHMRVIRYYDDFGQSGAPSMAIQTWDGSQFGDEKIWQAEHKVSDDAICVDFESATSVPCSGPHDLIWRTDKRPVPEVGFSINNPSFYVVRAPGVQVFQLLTTDAPAQLPTSDNSIPSSQCSTDNVIIPGAATSEAQDTQHEDCATKPWLVQSVFDEDATPIVPIEALIGGKSVFQLTATLHLAQWAADLDEENDKLHIHARCTPAEYSIGCTKPLTSQPKSITIPLDETTGKKWTFVDLCGVDSNETDDVYQPTMTQADTLQAGQWPQNDGFELLIQRDEGKLRVWISPSQPIVFNDDNRFDDATAPHDLWSIPGSETCD